MNRTDLWICGGLAIAALTLATIGAEKSIPRSCPQTLTAEYLPESWEPDDDNGLDDSLKFLREMSIRPTDFIEASFPKLYGAAVSAVLFRRLGSGLDDLYAEEPIRFVRLAYRAGFAVTALFSAALVVMLFLAARTSCSRPASVVAALALMLNTGVLTHAHFAVYDVHLLFFETLLLFLMVRGTGSVWLGAVAGALISVKYTGALFLPAMILDQRLKAGTFPRLRSIAASIGLAGAVFVVLNPYVLLDAPRFLHDIGVIYFTRSSFKGFRGESLAFSSHFTNLVEGGVFLAVLSLAAVFLAAVSRRRLRIEQVGLAAFLVFYLLSGWSRFNAVRFSLPLLPPLALLVAPLVDRLLRWRPRLSTAGLLLGLLYSFGACCETDLLFYRDSRLAARRFVDERGFQRVAGMGRPAYIQPAVPERGAVWLRPAQAPAAQPSLYYRAQDLYRRVLGREPASPPVAPTNVDYYEVNRAQLVESDAVAVVLSSFDTSRYFAQPEAFPPTTLFLGDLIGGRLGYSVAGRFQTRTYLVSRVEFVNPEIVVLERLVR